MIGELTGNEIIVYTPQNERPFIRIKNFANQKICLDTSQAVVDFVDIHSGKQLGLISVRWCNNENLLRKNLPEYFNSGSIKVNLSGKFKLVDEEIIFLVQAIVLPVERSQIEKDFGSKILMIPINEPKLKTESCD